MASYDLQTLTGVECVQFDGTNAADVIAITGPDAKIHPTEEARIDIPTGHNLITELRVGDWITSVAAGEYLVIRDDSFQALFTATP